MPPTISENISENIFTFIFLGYLGILSFNPVWKIEKMKNDFYLYEGLCLCAPKYNQNYFINGGFDFINMNFWTTYLEQK